MKNIKRVVSVILTGLMLSNFLVARAEGDDRILSLKFAEDGTVTDVYNNDLEQFGLDSGHFSGEVIDTMMGSRNVLVSEGGIIVIDGQKLVGSDEMTFETWIKISSNETAQRRMFALSNLEVEDEEVSMAEVLYKYDKTPPTARLFNRLGTNGNPVEDEWIEHSTGDIYEYADTWRHYSFTRKWDEESSTWTTKTYINGTLVASSEGEDGNRLNEDGCKLVVGSWKNPSNNKITSLNRGLKCTYGAFNVYGKELSAGRINEIYEETKNNFRASVGHMKVESVTPDEGKISTDSGIITLKFSNYIDDATVNGNVIFTKENGSPVDGWSVSVRDDIFIDISYPKLQHRENYKITIKPGLKSLNEVPAEEREIKYSARGSGFIIDEDFQGNEFVVGQKSPQISGIQFVSNHVNYSSDYIKVGQTEKGTKYLRLSPVNMNKSESINILLDGVTEACPVVEYKIRVGGDDSIEPRMGMLNGVNGTYLYTLTNPIKTANGLVDTDEEGFASFKVIIKKNKSGFYYYELHYTIGGEEKVEDISFDAKKITKVDKYNVIQYYQTNGVVSSDNYIDLSYLCHYILNEPKVVESNLTTLDTESEDIVTVTFNEAMNESTIGADTVKLIDKKDDSSIPWTFVSYDAENKTASFRVDNKWLEYNADYDIDCYGVETEAGIKNAVSMKSTFSTAPLDITLSRKAFSQTDAGISFNATVDSEKSAEVKFIAVLYDLNKRAVQVKTQTVNVNAGSGSAEMLMDYSDIKPGYTVKVIAAEIDEDNLKPITKLPLEYQVR